MINGMQRTSPRRKTALIWLTVILLGLGGTESSDEALDAYAG